MNNNDNEFNVTSVPSNNDEPDLPVMPAIHTEEVIEEVNTIKKEFELPEMPSSPIEIAPVPKMEIEEEVISTPKFNIPESELIKEEPEEVKEEIKPLKEVINEEVLEPKQVVKKKKINPKIFIVLGVILFILMILLLIKVFIIDKEENDDLSDNEYFNSLKNTGYYDDYKGFSKEWVGTYKNSDNKLTLNIFLTSNESYSIEFIDDSSKSTDTNKTGIESYGGGFGGKSGTLVDSLYKIIFKKKDNTIVVNVTEETDDEIISKASGEYKKVNINDNNYNGIYNYEDYYLAIYVYDEDGNAMFYYKKDNNFVSRYAKLKDDNIVFYDCTFGKKDKNYLFSCKDDSDEYIKNINNKTFIKK